MFSISTIVSEVGQYEPKAFGEAFPGMLPGAEIDDAWLKEEGYGRRSDQIDYTIDATSHRLIALDPPVYNETSGLWDVWQVAAIPLDDLKAAKIFQVDALYDEKLTQGAHWNGTLFDINDASQTKFSGAGAAALGVVGGVPGALAWPDGFEWIAFDNTMIPMTAAECYAFTQTMGQAITGLVLTARAIKNACLAAADVAALNAIDITAGWPTV